ELFYDASSLLIPFVQLCAPHYHEISFVFFFQAEDGIRDRNVTGVQTCALPISLKPVKDTAHSPMALAFKSTLRGYSAYLEKAERQILRSLFSDVLTLLGGVSPADTQLEEDGPKFFDRFRSRDQIQHLPEAPSTDDLSGTDAAFWDLVGSLADDEVQIDLTDPAVKRLLPDARSGEDAEQGSEQFRQLAQDDIRQEKIADL